MLTKIRICWSQILNEVKIWRSPAEISRNPFSRYPWFPGQSDTFVFTFSDEDTGQYPIEIFLHQEIPPPLKSGMDFLSITSVYLYKFIIPSIGRREPTPEKLKTPQTIFFGGPSLPHWNRQDLTVHPFWSWQICCASLERKNDFRLKTAHFPIFYTPISIVLHTLNFYFWVRSCIQRFRSFSLSLQ